MKKKSRLSKARQKLAIEYMPLVKMLARYFVSQREHWQRKNFLPELEGEGYLALSKAAVTYDKKRLPYPKAYFARAILNSMLKFMKKNTKFCGVRIPLVSIEGRLPVYDEIDHLKMAIESLDEEDQEFAVERFMNDKTLRSLSEDNDLPMRIVVMRNRRLMKTLCHKLGIRLSNPGEDAGRLGGCSNPQHPSDKQASSSFPNAVASVSDPKSNPRCP